MEWFGLNGGSIAATLENIGKNPGKQKPRRLLERAGFSKKSMI
jgi:hypothetical protein